MSGANNFHRMIRGNGLMYKVVRITDLNYSPTFDSTDKVIELSNDFTKLTVAENDYSHKNKAYLSDAINTTEKSLKSYRDAINKIDTTYLTSKLQDVYLPNGSLITKETLDKIMQSNAFLTKEACKEFETKCISYINELKNKTVSIMMAQLNESFIAQNSVGKLSFGQYSGSDNYNINWIKQIASGTEPSTGNYNFETGEFSLNQLLYGRTDFKSTEGTKLSDFWKDHYQAPISSYFPNEKFEEFEDLYDKIINELAFNANTENSKALDYKIHVPKASYDFKKNESIPIAKLVETFLKKQIKTVIKRLCDIYIAKMISVPSFDKTSSS